MKKTRKKNRIFVGFSVCLLIILCGIGATAIYGYSFFEKIKTVDIDINNLAIDPETDKKLSSYSNIQNIALFGVDAVKGDDGRSDSIMILTIDRNNSKIKLTSIMRDSYVNIIGKSKDKLNHAYAYGGPQLAIQTLNNNFDLNIKDFASVNFSGLQKIIDILGGVEVSITQDEIPYLANYINSINSFTNEKAETIKVPGIYNLNGTQALAYTRIRYTEGNDYKRTERQRIVLTKVFEKIKDTSVKEWPNLLNEILPLIETNMDVTEILSIGTAVAKMGNVNIEQERFPMDKDCHGTMIDGVYYLDFDEETTVTSLHDYIFKDIRSWE